MSEEVLQIVAGPAAGMALQVNDSIDIGLAALGAGDLGADPELSRLHARITRGLDGLTLEDLGSTNGTRVNGRRITAAVKLRAGDRIELGGSALEVRPVAGAGAQVALTSMPAFNPPRARTQRRRNSTSLWVMVVAMLVVITGFFATRDAGVGITTDTASGVDGTVYVETNVAASGQNSVLALHYHAGSFRPLQIDEYPTGGSGSADLKDRGVLDADGQLVTNSSDSLLFAVNQGSDTVAAFHIGQGGSLTPVSGSPFPSGGTAPTSLAVSGDLLVVANKAFDGVRELTSVQPDYATFFINGDGSLTATGHSFVLNPLAAPVQVNADPGTDLIFATEESGVMRAFTLGSGGQLTQAPGSPQGLPNWLFTDGPRPNPVWPAGLSFNPNHQIIYSGMPNYSAIMAIDYSSNGRFSFQSVVTDNEAHLPCWSVVSSDGKTLYFANAGSDNVSVWNIATDPNHPQLIQTVALRGGGNPWNLRLDPDGHYLYVITPRQVAAIVPAGSGQLLHSLSIASDGTLTELADSPVPLPVALNTNPFGLALVPAQ